MSETSELWDKVAEIDYTLDEISNSQRKLALDITECLNELKVIPPAELIELGSGSGVLSSILAEQGYQTTLVDFSSVALEKSKLFFHKKQLSGEFLLGDIFNVSSLVDKTYDVSWNSGVMEHFHAQELLALFKSIYSITKKFYICIVPNPESLPYLLFRYKAMKKGTWLYGLEFLRDDYENIAQDAGFKLVKKKYLGIEFTQDYINYFFGVEAAKDYQEFIENGLAPTKESYLLMYVFQVTDTPMKKIESADSWCELKTEMFDSKALTAKRLEEQEKQFAEEKQRNQIIKQIIRTFKRNNT